MNIKRLLLIPATLLAAAAFSPANALTIKLYDGTNTWQVADGDASDTDGAANAVNIAGTFGIWTVNVQFADSNSPGTLEGAFIHSTTSLRSAAAGFLEITIWDEFTAPLTPGSLTYLSGGSGTNPGTVTGYASKLDEAQTYLQTEQCTRALNGAACAESVSHGDLTGGYTMTLFQRIEVDGATRSFSIDSDVYNVPEPGTMAMFGLGLLGLGFAARRRAR